MSRLSIFSLSSVVTEVFICSNVFSPIPSRSEKIKADIIFVVNERSLIF